MQALLRLHSSLHRYAPVALVDARFLFLGMDLHCDRCDCSVDGGHVRRVDEELEVDRVVVGNPCQEERQMGGSL